MLPALRRLNACIHQNVLDKDTIVRRLSGHSQAVNLLYRTQHNQLFAQVSPINIISFQQVPLALFKPFSNSFTSRSGNGIKSTNDDIPEKMNNIAYKLMYVKLKEDDIVKLSALWMQVMEGPCKGPKPATEDSFRNLAYWQSWKSLGNMSKEEAMQNYLAIAEKYI